jgi:hypothetical protein
MALQDKVLGWYNALPEKVRTVIWSAGRAFVGAVIVLIPGILAAPSFNTEKALVVAAIFAGAVAAVRVVQHAVQAWLGQTQ